MAQKSGVLDHVFFARKRKIEDKSIKIPVYPNLQCGISEPWMINLLRNVMPHREGAFIDIGANLGQTLVKVQAVAPEIQYVGFEPNPICVFYLWELIKLNEWHNCTIVPAGLYPENKILNLECIGDKDADSGASIIHNFRSNRQITKTIPVPVLNYQSIQNTLEIGPVGFIKIDVEGAELDVVETLRPLIEKNKPILLVEILPVHKAENIERKKRQEELLRILKSLKYKVFRIQKKNGEFFELVPINDIGIHGDLDLCDYIMVPCEISDSFMPE